MNLFEEKKKYEVIPITAPIDTKRDKPKKVKYHYTCLRQQYGKQRLLEQIEELKEIGYEVCEEGITYDRDEYEVTMRKAIGFKEKQKQQEK